MRHSETPGSGDNTFLTDQFSRTISYLRLSLTDQCNLRCRYCTPRGEFDKLASDELLSYEELFRVVHLAVGMGIRKLRLTGGEPLVRRHVLNFIQRLGKISGLDDIRLTTNGVMLEQMGAELLAAGIRTINVSLDTMRPELFAEITGKDFFHQVWNGIQHALALGFSPVKINVVAMRGVNDAEFIDFARLTLDYPIQVRFIEFMPIGEHSTWGKDRFISAEEIMELLSPLGELVELPRRHLDGPARIYKLADASPDMGRIGFISPISHHFCDQCNRLRLTSEGRLRACLLSDVETDLKAVLRKGASDDEVCQTIRDTIAAKPKGHVLQDRLSEGATSGCHGRMSRIGG